jgi:hypothetical protein
VQYSGSRGRGKICRKSFWPNGFPYWFHVVADFDNIDEQFDNIRSDPSPKRMKTLRKDFFFLQFRGREGGLVNLLGIFERQSADGANLDAFATLDAPRPGERFILVS